MEYITLAVKDCWLGPNGSTSRSTFRKCDVGWWRWRLTCAAPATPPADIVPQVWGLRISTANSTFSRSNSNTALDWLLSGVWKWSFFLPSFRSISQYEKLNASFFQEESIVLPILKVWVGQRANTKHTIANTQNHLAGGSSVKWNRCIQTFDPHSSCSVKGACNWQLWVK